MGRHVSVLIYVKREIERRRHKRGLSYVCRLCAVSVVYLSVFSVTCFRSICVYISGCIIVYERL